MAVCGKEDVSHLCNHTDEQVNVIRADSSVHDEKQIHVANVLQSKLCGFAELAI